MKKLFFAFTALCFTTQAYADYIPGRVRVSAEGPLAATYSDGIFSEIKSAKVLELTTDGKGITGYILEFNNSSNAAGSINFNVTKQELTRCGIIILAESEPAKTPDGINYKIKIAADSNQFSPTAGCSGPEVRWLAEIIAVGGLDGATSSLKLEGIAEYFALTQ